MAADGSPTAGRGGLPDVAGDALAQLQERLRDLAQDLMTLEVNTIYRDNISGTKLPAIGHALIDIASVYNTALLKLGALPPALAPGAKDEGTVASWSSFHELRMRARGLRDQISTRSDAAAKQPGRGAEAAVARDLKSLSLLGRIMDNSDQLKGLFETMGGGPGAGPAFTRARPGAPRLAPKELVMVRKIWELGTEEVMIQTVIGLDADVITRLQPHCAEPAHKGLVEIHQGAVVTSIGLWKELVTMLGSFIENAAKLFPHGS